MLRQWLLRPLLDPHAISGRQDAVAALIADPNFGPAHSALGWMLFDRGQREEAMECFSEGIRVAQFCHKKLEDAESRVQMLLKDQQGGWAAAPFETQQNSGEGK